jgi:hypothetical protein
MISDEVDDDKASGVEWSWVELLNKPSALPCTATVMMSFDLQGCCTSAMQGLCKAVHELCVQKSDGPYVYPSLLSAP